MDNLLLIEKIPNDPSGLRIVPRSSPRDISLIPSMLLYFEKAMKEDVIRIEINLGYIDELPPSFIVMLFEMTARARRKGGDVKILSLTEKGKLQLELFKSLDYLTVEPTGKPVQSGNIATSERLQNAAVKSHRQGKELKSHSIQVPSRVDDLYLACDYVIKIAKQMGFSEGELGKIKIATYEACLNVIEHVYHSDPNQYVKLAVENDSNMLRIVVFDKGAGFKITDKKSFDVVEMVNNRKTGGMGLHIISRSMDSVRYETDIIEGNKLVMTKYLNTKKS